MMPKTAIRAALFAILTTASFAGGDWQSGLDATLEASVGIEGGAQSGQALHGLALAHATWQQGETGQGAPTFSAYFSALGLAGKGPSERFIGDFLAASNIEGYPSVRVYSWWVQAVGHDWSLRAGALLADEEFAGTTAGGNFFNSSFGWPAFISANTINTGPAFFVAAPGLRLEFKGNESIACRVGIYDGDTFDSPSGDPAVNQFGLHYRLGGNQGWFAIAEVSVAQPNAATRFKIGAWLHTAAFSDLHDDASGNPFVVTGNQPREYGSNHGGYFAVEHTLAGTTGSAGNIEFFFRVGMAPSDRNAIDWAIDSGLAMTGPLPGRPADVVSIGVAQAQFSSGFRAQAQLTDPFNATPDYERVIEINYKYRLSDRFSLQPDLQYIWHPGGSHGQPDALAFFLRFNASY